MQLDENNGLGAVLAHFDRRMRLARASELALSGRLLEAETLLVSTAHFPDTWEELDLLARIRVREGKLADAMRLWRKGAKTGPHSGRAPECIASLEGYAAAKFKRDRQMFIAAWALWSIAVAAIVLVVWRACR